jgi:hypothetical protein
MAGIDTVPIGYSQEVPLLRAAGQQLATRIGENRRMSRFRCSVRSYLYDEHAGGRCEAFAPGTPPGPYVAELLRP